MKSIICLKLCFEKILKIGQYMKYECTNQVQKLKIKINYALTN